MKQRLAVIGVAVALCSAAGDSWGWGATRRIGGIAPEQSPFRSAVPIASPIIEGSCSGAWLRGEAFLAQWGGRGPAVLKAACERAVRKVAREEQCDVVDGAVIATASKPGNVITLVNCKNGQQMRQISVKD